MSPDPGRSNRRCGQSLTDVPVIPVTDRRLLELQRWIDHGLGEGPRPATGPSAKALFVFPVTVYVALRLRAPEMFTTADPAITAATADQSGVVADLAEFHGHASTDAAHPLLIAGAISLADRLSRGKTRRETAAMFADIAYEQLATRTAKWSTFEPLPVPWRMARYICPAAFSALVERGAVQETTGYRFLTLD